MIIKTDDELRNTGYKDFGWANNWSEAPKEIIKCNTLKHKKEEISYSPRGFDHTVICHICQFFYKYDSSD